MTEWAVGIDIEELDKVRKAISNKRFVERTFTKKEIAYSKSKGGQVAHYAGIFAAKEAVFKATSHMLPKGRNFVDVEILHQKSGMPFVRFRKQPRSKAINLEIRVSISHSGNYAAAVAFATQSQRNT